MERWYVSQTLLVCLSGYTSMKSKTGYRGDSGVDPLTVTEIMILTVTQLHLSRPGLTQPNSSLEPNHGRSTN